MLFSAGLAALLGGSIVAARADSSTAPATQPRQASPAVEEGFVPLFNGKDLTGWTYTSKAGEGYQVDPATGDVYCTRKDGGQLFTDKQYGDFALRFEFRLEENGNNGVAIRAPRQGRIAYEGIEIQVLDDAGSEYTKLRPTQYHGSIYDVVPAKRGAQLPAGEWNEQEIIAKGRQITVKLNGQTIVDANLDEVTDPAVLQKHPGLQNTTGHIGLLGHGRKVEFRNMRIKDLAAQQ